MSMIDQHQLDTVKSILGTHLPGYEVWIFGSRATDTAKPFSDLDLAVKGAAPLTLAQRARLESDFEDSDLPFRVDVVDLSAVDASFRSVIMQTAKPLPVD